MSCQMFSGILCSFLADGADARVGDDDVEPAELFHAAVHRGLERVVVTHVDFGGHDAAVVGLDQIGGLGKVCRCRMRVGQVVDRPADVDGDDVGALLGQPDRVAAALAARGAADERDLALNPAGHREVTLSGPASTPSPRTVDVGLRRAFAKSTSHRGKRLRISSRAIRPSRRASAEPRQKWVPTLKARC